MTAFVYDAVRTPFGKFNGGLAGVRPDDLAAVVLGAILERNPDLDPGAVDEVILGNANGAGEDNRNVARMASLLAGIPVAVPGSTVNRLCGSSLDAARVQAGIAVTDGVEYDGGEVIRAYAGQASVELAERGPDGVVDERGVHAGAQRVPSRSLSSSSRTPEAMRKAMLASGTPQ